MNVSIVTRDVRTVSGLYTLCNVRVGILFVCRAVSAGKQFGLCLPANALRTMICVTFSHLVVVRIGRACSAQYIRRVSQLASRFYRFKMAIFNTKMFAVLIVFRIEISAV